MAAAAAIGSRHQSRKSWDQSSDEISRLSISSSDSDSDNNCDWHSARSSFRCPSPSLSAKNRITKTEETIFNITIGSVIGDVNPTTTGTIYIYKFNASNEDIIKHLSKEMKIPIQSFREALKSMRVETKESAPMGAGAKAAATNGSCASCGRKFDHQTDDSMSSSSVRPTVVEVSQRSVDGHGGNLLVQLRIKRSSYVGSMTSRYFETSNDDFPYS